MTDSKILITNYPNFYTHLTCSQTNNHNKTIDIQCGYDFSIKHEDSCLCIARDIIMALLTFDHIYVEGNNINELLSVLSADNLKELLRLKILHIIPDQNLNPAVVTENKISKPDFFSYSLGKEHDGSKDEKWIYVENILNNHKINSKERSIILYLIDENCADLGNEEKVIEQIKNEVNKDIRSPNSNFNSNFCRINPNGRREYFIPHLIRLQELNKTAVIAATLNIDNIKTDAAINELLLHKTTSVFSKSIHCGTDVIQKIEQEKGFPDLGELFINNIINLEDILKLRDNFQNKIFRYWIKKLDSDELLVRKEIMNSVDNIIGSKLTNPLRFIGSNLIGLLGFIPGLAASAFDSFILDKISKGWHPNFFLDDVLKKEIDKCIDNYGNKRKIEKIKSTFSGVGRNDLCPCGSGKKFKKCHGKDL